MVDEKTKLCCELTTFILKENDDLIGYGHLTAGLRKYRISYSLLDKIYIDENFSIHSDQTYSRELADTFYLIIDSAKDFMQIMVGREEAQLRISKSAEKFLSNNFQAVLSTRLYEDFPGLFKLDRKISHLKDLRGEDETVQIQTIFESLIATIVKASSEEDQKNYKSILENYESEKSIGIYINEKKDVTLDIKGDSVSVIDLSMMINEMVARNKSISKRYAHNLIHTVIAKFGELPDELEITNHLLDGAFAKKISTGIPVLDRALNGGIPRGHSILIQGPAGVEKDLISSRFVDYGLLARTATLALVSTESPDIFLSRLSPLIMPKADTGNDLIEIVDWHTCMHSNVNGVEEHGNIYCSSKDLTHVGIAFDHALKNLPNTYVRRGYVNIISTSIRLFDFETTYEFIQTIRAKLRRNDITSIFLLDKDVCDDREIQILHDSFDGVIDIERQREGNLIIRDLGILSMLGTLFDGRRIKMELAEEGLWFYGSEDYEKHEDNTIDSLISLPLIKGDDITLHVDGFNKITESIPRNHSILIQGPSTEEKECLGYKLLGNGAHSNEPVLVLLSQTTLTEFQRMMTRFEIDVKRMMENGEMVIIDWQSFRTEMIDGIQEKGCIIKSSSDLTTLGMAIEKAISNLPKEIPKRAYIDLISPAIQIHELDVVCDFSIAMKARLKSANFTSFFILNKDMHEKKAIGMIHTIFDGIIDIDKYPRNNGLVS